MKKSATLLALLAAMLCTFSCMKETDFGTGPAPEGYYEEIITTVIPGGGTRTSFDNTTGVFSWSDGDEIAFHLSNGEYITAPINPETGKVRLYLPEGVTRDEFAVYPASTVVTDHAEKGDMQLTLPDSYDISGALQSEYCPTTMLAVQDPESSTLRFNHAGGLVQLNLEVPAQTKTVKVEFPDRVVTGTIPVSADNTYYKLDLDDPEHNEEGGSEIDITVSQEGLEEDTAVRINIPVPSGSYNDLKITYNDGNADTWEYDRDATLTVGRGAGKRISPDENEFTDIMDYFHFIALEDNSSVTFSCPNSAMYYSIDNKKTWNPYTSGTTITLENEGDIVWFYNTNNILSTQNSYAQFSGTGKLKAAGIIATLKNKIIDYQRVPNNNDTEYVYNRLFQGLEPLIDVSQLDMGGNYNIYKNGFFKTFYNCISLTNAPELPATILADGCYEEMFNYCTSLSKAPELPATTLAKSCYQSMFICCYGLLEAPELPATTLAESCYKNMFYNCFNMLKSPEELPATVLTKQCYYGMFEECSRMTTVPTLPATNLEESCYARMFRGCQKITEAPELPATTLFPECYRSMFGTCTSLTTAPELPATTLATRCYGSMFSICKKLTKAPELPATTLAIQCYEEMFNNCISLTTAPQLPATELKLGCYTSMFVDCISLEIAPELPAIKLEYRCYSGMFAGCTSLNEVKCFATDMSAFECTKTWLRNVSSTGTFYRNAAATDWTTGDSGIPSGWNVYIAEDIDAQI